MTASRTSYCGTRRAASTSSTRGGPSEVRIQESSVKLRELGLPKEREHGHDTAVHVGFFGEAELVEHRVDVLLDRAVGEERALRDRRVVQPLRHQRQHLALALGELRERGVREPVLGG